MKRLLTGTVLGGAVLLACSFFLETPPAAFGTAGHFLSAFLATLLLLQLGPRSLIEKVLFLLTVAVLSWAGAAGDAPSWRGLAGSLAAWILAGSALAWVVHPRSE